MADSERDEAIRIAITAAITDPDRGILDGHCDPAAFRAALAERGWVVEQGWQPIETAPRDGTHILVWIGGEQDYEIVYWSEDWYRADGEPLIDEARSEDVSAEPTHWKPLRPPAMLAASE